MGEVYKRLTQQDEIKRIGQELRQTEVIAIAVASGTKKGNRQYDKWRGIKTTELRDKQNEDKLTIFERLKKSKVSNTIFDRFKFWRRKK